MQTLLATSIHSQTAFKRANQDTSFPSASKKQQKQYLRTQIRPLEHPNQFIEAPNQYRHILFSPQLPSSHASGLPMIWVCWAAVLKRGFRDEEIAYYHLFPTSIHFNMYKRTHYGYFDE